MRFWLQMLDSMISTCLQMAVKDGAKSIAFPTVGCGRLAYDAKHVAESFVRCHKQGTSALQVKITILAYFSFCKVNDFVNVGIFSLLGPLVPIIGCVVGYADCDQ